MWTYNNNELYHYGVLGMKWGVRKSKEYKASKIQMKADKRNASYNKYIDKKIAFSNKMYNKINRRYDRKISKTHDDRKKKYITTKKEMYSKSVKSGTMMLKIGANYYNRVNNDYAKTRISALYDPSVKRTAKYKEAGSAYLNQRLTEAIYGKPKVVSMYNDLYRSYTN